MISKHKRPHCQTPKTHHCHQLMIRNSDSSCQIAIIIKNHRQIYGIRMYLADMFEGIVEWTLILRALEVSKPKDKAHKLMHTSQTYTLPKDLGSTPQQNNLPIVKNKNSIIQGQRCLKQDGTLSDSHLYLICLLFQTQMMHL